MLEQVLEGIKTDASPHKIRAFLSLVDSLDASNDKAEALAVFAKNRITANALEALKAMQCAYRLAPKKDSVLEAIEWCFEQLKRIEAQQRLAQYRKSIGPKFTMTIEQPPAEFTIEFDKNSQTSQMKIERTTIGRQTESDAESPAKPTINLEFDIDHATNTESISLPLVVAANEEPPELSIVPPEPKVSLTFTQNDFSYALFGEFLRASKVDFRLLEKAEGFQDSMLGLVLFVNFLFENGLVSKEQTSSTVLTLKSFVSRKSSDVRSQVRFHELFELDHKG